MGYAKFHDDDKEISASIKAIYGNWSIGGGYRKTYIDGQDNQGNNNISASTPSAYDDYREGQAYDIGLGYEFGPIQTSLTYFESKADGAESKDEIITASAQYQLDKYIDVYLSAAHVDFQGDDNINDNNKGYTFVVGLEMNL